MEQTARLTFPIGPIPSSSVITELLTACDAANSIDPVAACPGSFAAQWISSDQKTIEVYRSPSLADGVYLAHAAGTTTPEWTPPPTAAFPVRAESIAAILAQTGLAPPDSWQPNVDRLPVGHAATLTSAGNLNVRRVRTLQLRPSTRLTTAPAAAARLRELLSAAIERCSRNSHVAVSLSGGVDSSIVALEASRFASDLSLVHLSWGPNAELQSAEAVAKQIGVPLTVVDVHELASKPTFSLDPPFTHQDPRWTRAKYQAAGDLGATVFLTGDFADEIFQGDPRIQGGFGWELRHPTHAGHVPRFVRYGTLREIYRNKGARPSLTKRLDQLHRYTSPDEARLRSSGSLSWINHDHLHRLIAIAETATAQYLGELASATECKVLTPHQIGKWITTRHLVEDLQLDSFRPVAAAYGLERRAPFSDPDVIEFCWSLPESLRTTRVSGTVYRKALLRAAYAGLLPSGIQQRTGQPAVNATELGTFNGLRAQLREALEPTGPLARSGLLNPAGVQKLFEEPHNLRRSYRYLMSSLRLHSWFLDYGHLT